MKQKAVLLAASFSLATLFSCNGQKGSDVSLKTAADSVAYGIGVSIGTNMKKDGLNEINLDILKEGMAASMKGETLKVSLEESQRVIQDYLAAQQKKKSEGTITAGKKFQEENKNKPGVKVTESGLQYSVIKEGTGPKPLPTDTVRVHYHGTLIDGSVFDSSVDRGEPAEFPLNAVIMGWTEGLQLMNVGSKYRFVIPSELAYGERQAGPTILPHSTLVFEVELLSIKGK